METWSSILSYDVDCLAASFFSQHRYPVLKHLGRHKSEYLKESSCRFTARLLF